MSRGKKTRRRPPSGILKLCISDVIYMFQIKVPMSSHILVTIGQIVKEWQQFFEIQDGGGRHLELWLVRFFDVTDVIYIKLAIFLLNLAMIGQIVKRW